MRGAIVVSGGAQGRLLGDKRRLIERVWVPGERIVVEGIEEIAPQQAECVPLFTIPLDAPVLGGDSPDTALVFSPDGHRLAIGAHTGQILLADAWTGETLASRSLAETLIRQVRFSPDGSVLYAAEQSPDANVYALDASTLETLASYRLADDVGTSPKPDASDLYGVYTLPAAYGMEVLPGGDLLVVATHGWGEGESRRNASRVLRLRREGARFNTIAAWPAAGPADAVTGAVAVGGDRVAVALRRSARGPAPADLPIDGLMLLSVDTLAPAGTERFEPLLPYFQGVFIWDSLAVGDGWLAVGMGDGRLVFRSLGPPGVEQVEPIGAPTLAGAVPIAASIGFVRAVGDELFAVTSRTAIPYGAAAPELRPPGAHPGENTLWRYRRADGRWTRSSSWRGAPVLTGLAAMGPNNPLGEIVVGAGPRDGDDRVDQFGALVFSRDSDDPIAMCATQGPAFHRLAVTTDGRIAIAEVPWRVADEVRGRYQITVMR